MASGRGGKKKRGKAADSDRSRKGKAAAGNIRSATKKPGRPSPTKSRPKNGKRDSGVRKGHGSGGRGVGKVGAGRGKKPVSRSGGQSKKPVSKAAASLDRLAKKKKAPPSPVKKPRRPKPKPRPAPAPKRKPRKPKRPAPKPTPKKRRRPVVPQKRKPPKRKPPKRKPPAPPPEPPKRKPPKKRPPGKPLQPVPENSINAEHIAQEYLADMQLAMMSMGLDLDLSVRSFVNRDWTMDAELRIANLPPEWKILDGVPSMMEFLSIVLERMGLLGMTFDGGGFWMSIGVRFGASNESEIGELAELYKRHRGQFQIASYPVSMSIAGGTQNAVVAIGNMTKALMEKRGKTPTVIFVRIIWMPKGVTPSRFKGEKGGGD